VSVVASGKLSGKLSRRLLASMACADVLIVVRAGKFTGGLRGIVSRCRGFLRSQRCVDMGGKVCGYSSSQSKLPHRYGNGNTHTRAI